MLVLAIIGGLFLFCLIGGISLAIIDIKLDSAAPHYKRNEEKDNSIRLASWIMGNAR
jgi:hypothetical protein